MGEFGFITADGIYHVTVYATDENGKFHIISMKNYPYVGPVTPKLQSVSAPTTTTSTTQRTTTLPLKKYNFNTAACSGCFLSKSPAIDKEIPSPGNRSTKTDIRTLSQPLAPSQAAADVQPGQQPFVSSAEQQPVQQPGSSSPSSNPKFGNAGQQPAISSIPTSNTQQKTGISNNPSFRPSVGNAAASGLPSLPASKPGQQPITSSFSPLSSTPTKTGAVSGQSAGTPGLTGDLYKFKYLLDYNGHEETGSRNGDKQGKYFAIGDDAIERTVEYIANEFGFQPHITWRKLEGDEAVLPDENSLKHYEFKWFNKE